MNNKVSFGNWRVARMAVMLFLTMMIAQLAKADNLFDLNGRKIGGKPTAKRLYI